MTGRKVASSSKPGKGLGVCTGPGGERICEIRKKKKGRIPWLAVVLRKDRKMTSVSRCLKGGVILGDRERGRSMWEDGQLSSEPVEFEGPMGLRRKCLAGCWICRSKAQGKSRLAIKIWEPSVFLVFAA